MDADLEKSIGAILDDPEQMGRIAQLAQQFMGGGEAKSGAAPEPPPMDAKLLSALTKAMSAGEGNDDSAALLRAMRPYLKPERREKMDRALQVARAVRIAGAVFGETGGDGHGL